jgi:predicted NAD/FAD-dependent oxidoreductase
MAVMQPLVIVVGAGVAGLTCARELIRRGVSCVVLERSERIGGRCGTLSIDDQPVDHGIAFLHAQSREFALELDALGDDGKLRGWPLRVRESRSATLPAGLRGQRRMARRSGVAEFPAYLAREVEVRCGCEITALATAGERVRLTLADRSTIEAPFVAIATALDDALRMVTPVVSEWPGAAAHLAGLRALRWVPTLTLVVRYPDDAPEPGFDLWHPGGTAILGAVVHDSGKRSEHARRVLVLHAREAFSREYLNRDPDEWASEMLWEAGQLLGGWAARPAAYRTHAWPCARLRPGQTMGEVVTFESPAGGSVSLCGDAFAAQTGLEGAYMSGIALGEQIATLPRVREQVRA